MKFALLLIVGMTAVIMPIKGTVLLNKLSEGITNIGVKIGITKPSSSSGIPSLIVQHEVSHGNSVNNELSGQSQPYYNQNNGQQNNYGNNKPFGPPNQNYYPNNGPQNNYGNNELHGPHHGHQHGPENNYNNGPSNNYGNNPHGPPHHGPSDTHHNGPPHNEPHHHGSENNFNNRPQNNYGNNNPHGPPHHGPHENNHHNENNFNNGPHNNYGNNGPHRPPPHHGPQDHRPDNNFNNGIHDNYGNINHHGPPHQNRPQNNYQNKPHNNFQSSSGINQISELDGTLDHNKEAEENYANNPYLHNAAHKEQHGARPYDGNQETQVNPINNAEDHVPDHRPPEQQIDLRVGQGNKQKPSKDSTKFVKNNITSIGTDGSVFFPDDAHNSNAVALNKTAECKKDVEYPPNDPCIKLISGTKSGGCPPGETNNGNGCVSTAL